MIITRTPLRISFVGGGSDRPGFYYEEPGACVAAAIDKYVYVAVNRKFDDSIRVAYSQTENVARSDDLQHELVREAMRIVGRPTGIEIHSIADIPSGTGLGSSSSFTVGLLAALDADESRDPGNAQWLARKACEIEMYRCQKPIGKQDQYTAAYGGLNLLRFDRDRVTVEPIACDVEALSSHCLLLDTGLSRQGDAGQVLAAQQQDRDDVRELAALADRFVVALEHDNWRGCGAILDMAWHIKRRWVSDGTIDHLYLAARQAGAWGGKLCGAGGGGFLLFLAPQERHATITEALQLRHVPIAIVPHGSQVVYAD